MHICDLPPPENENIIPVIPFYLYGRIIVYFFIYLLLILFMISFCTSVKDGEKKPALLACLCVFVCVCLWLSEDDLPPPSCVFVQYQFIRATPSAVDVKATTLSSS